jgi:hypothetical protein
MERDMKNIKRILNPLSRGAAFTLLTLAFAISTAACSILLTWNVSILLRLAGVTGFVIIFLIWMTAYRIRLQEGTAVDTAGRVSPHDADRNRFLILHVIYLLVFMTTMFGGLYIRHAYASTTLRLGGAAVPALVLLVWAWEFVRLIRRADEMMQLVYYRSIAIGAGAVVLGGAIWGLLEQIVNAPSIPMVMGLPVFASAFGAAMLAQGQLRE